MIILSIETSCDETAISLVRASGGFPHATYEILGNALWSQVDVHAEYGGVFPAVAKREHARLIVPMLEKALGEAGMLEERIEADGEAGEKSGALFARLATVLEREPDLFASLKAFLETYDTPEIDLIAVTAGPGLEPALWVGVNFAKALALAWDVEVVPVNHMEGHIFASVFDAERDDMLADISFPAVALLISGGHTELIGMSDWGKYEKIGQTRDDAVGEAFDKVARLLGIPYPGGPEVSKQAAKARQLSLPTFAALPTPMLHSGDLDFSFSGLKTAVRYAVRDYEEAEGRELTDEEKMALCRDFEDVVGDVLVAKVLAAVEQTGAQTLIVGGGVAQNHYLKRRLEAALLAAHPDLTAYFPAPGLATDNSIMIALAGHARAASRLSPAGASAISAQGRKSLT